MKKVGLIVALAALGTGSAYASNFPVPSFNDFPEHYSHTLSSNASAGQSSPAAAPSMDYGPWIVIPSSGE